MNDLRDEELLLRLKNFEDNFVERKTSGDSKDWLKTVVVFANTTPVGYPAVLCIGVKNDGTPEEKTVDLDSLQKTFSEKVSEAYPPIYYLTKIVNIGGKQVLAVIIPGSADRPHFAGLAYIREGSKSVAASITQFDELIASRNNKVREILKWKDTDITVAVLGVAFPGEQFFSIVARKVAVVRACNQFYVTLEFPDGKKTCVPLTRTDVSFDEAARRLELEMRLD
jgi:hypothetical protein